MLTWPHSGFHVHAAVWVPEDDCAFATRLARYCALSFLSQLTRYRFGPLEYLWRWLTDGERPVFRVTPS